MKRFTIQSARYKFVLCFLAINFFSVAFANRVVVSGGTRNLPYTGNTVTFSLTWDHSWNVAGSPGNHDAVWVFMKYRECGQSAWNHALLNTTMGTHTLASALAFAKPILTTDKWGLAGANNTGALIRRSALGSGTTTGSVTLNIVGSSTGVVLNPTLQYDIAVFAIEMVQVKQGSNTVGDGYSQYQAFYSMPIGSNLPQVFTTEAGIQTVVTYVNYYTVPVPVRFPKGVDEFYCMKYEISQGQYADFLNNIGSAASSRHYSADLNYMYNIAAVGGLYTANPGNANGDCTDRAWNRGSFTDLMSYLDWAALRPMTEFEYERACRGDGAAPALDYAWGSAGVASVIESVNLTGAGAGVEVCTDLNANCNYYGPNYYHFGTAGNAFGAGNYGPVGCGIFARDATLTRATTGGSYWGIMELTGNIWETCIQPNTNEGNPSTFSGYTGLWGNGQLNNGVYDVTNWPVNGTWIALRGGAWDTGSGFGTGLTVSSRAGASYTDYMIRYANSGGRGVR